jgi:hypothetical protein
MHPPLKRRTAVPHTHRIASCDTKIVETEAGEKPAIFLAADLFDGGAIDVLVHDVMERFKVHRAVSPRDTALLLVTVLGPPHFGPAHAADVAKRLRALLQDDDVARAALAGLETADVAVAPRDNPHAGSFHSLLLELH